MFEMIASEALDSTWKTYSGADHLIAADLKRLGMLQSVFAIDGGGSLREYFKPSRELTAEDWDTVRESVDRYEARRHWLTSVCYRGSFEELYSKLRGTPAKPAEVSEPGRVKESSQAA